MHKKLLICDLDNTLYDWVGYFVAAFYAMVDEAVRITGCDREKLLDDLRAVHRKHHDSEHPFSLLEATIIQQKFPGLSRKEMAIRLDGAFHAFNSRRKSNLRVYPGVHEGLAALSQAGIILVAHTESKLYAAVDRLNRLNLTDYFKRIYCRERPTTNHPDPDVEANLRSRLPLHKIVELSHHQRKPNPEVLREICRDEEVHPNQAAYVGDSVARDLLMAQEAGVLAIWAKYGSSAQTVEYEGLVRVTHWTDADISREQELRKAAEGLTPDYILERDFSEIKNLLIPSSERIH